ncbi:MFS transporter [Dactylosporangium sp. NPDC051485]|uniref:MFS transporter n=1 Tax=Dactylosporangium sp. NPDC051485 TaxID=3154846 RepID=UPI003435AD8E
MSSAPHRTAGTGPEPAPAGGRATALTLTILVSCELMLMLDGTIINVALPVIRDGLGFSTAGLSWVVNAFLLAFGGLLLLGGRAGDILGRRRVFVAGIALFTVGSLLGGLAQTGEWLVAMRALQGIGAAAAGPSTLALLITNFQGPAQTRALGIYSSMTASAMTLGLILGGILVTVTSWRWVLLVNVPIGLLVVLCTPRYVAEAPRHPGRFDLLGAVTSAAGAVGVVYGLVRTADHGWRDWLALSGLGAGVLLLVAFVLVERAASQPIMPLALLADRTRAGAYLSLLLIPMVTLSMQFLLIQFLQEVSGFNPLQAGLAFLPMAAGMLLTATAAAKLLGRFGAKATAAAGVVLLLAATGWLTQISATTGYLTGVFGPLLLAGAGLGLVTVPLNVTLMSTVAPQDSGAAAGLLQALMMSGATLGVAVLSTVYASVLNDTPQTPGTAPAAETIADGMRSGFLTSTGIAVLALLTVLLAIGSRTHNPPAPTTEATPTTADQPELTASNVDGR